MVWGFLAGAVLLPCLGKPLLGPSYSLPEASYWEGMVWAKGLGLLADKGPFQEKVLCYTQRSINTCSMAARGRAAVTSQLSSCRHNVRYVSAGVTRSAPPRPTDHAHASSASCRATSRQSHSGRAIFDGNVGAARTGFGPSERAREPKGRPRHADRSETASTAVPHPRLAGV
jgi:hypothetical protein